MSKATTFVVYQHANGDFGWSLASERLPADILLLFMHSSGASLYLNDAHGGMSGGQPGSKPRLLGDVVDEALAATVGKANTQVLDGFNRQYGAQPQIDSIRIEGSRIVVKLKADAWGSPDLPSRFGNLDVLVEPGRQPDMYE